MKNLLTKFKNDESGATAIEYGLIAALISVGIIVAVTALGNNLAGVFNNLSDKLAPAAGTTPPA
jgi:pilus assembly protein Flp/PilA